MYGGNKMFDKKSKYFKWYNNIIIKAINRQKPDGYCERHHILPVCLGGDKRDKNNIVILTAKEHYICHHLLYHATIGQAKHKMGFAWYMMCWDKRGGKERFVTAHGYEKARLNVKKIISISNTGKNKGSKHCRYNPTIYSFYNVETKEIFNGTEYDLQLYDNSIKSSEICRIIKYKNKQSKGWMFYDGTNIPKKHNFKEDSGSIADLNVYTFKHPQYDIFIGTRHDLKRKYNECDFRCQGLTDIIKGRQKEHRGWSIIR